MKGHHKQRNDYQKNPSNCGFSCNFGGFCYDHGKGAWLHSQYWNSSRGLHHYPWANRKEEWKDRRKRERQKLREEDNETETERDSACLTWAFETSKPKPSEIPHSTKPHQLQLGHTS